MQIRNIKRMFPEQPGYICEIDFGNNGNWLPFGAVPDDPEPHGREIHQRILDGEFGPIDPYQEEVIPPQRLLEAEMQGLLQYLLITDWYVIRNQETGEIVPSQILTDRANARVRISEIRVEIENL